MLEVEKKKKVLVETTPLQLRGYVLDLWDNGRVTWRKLKVIEHPKPKKESKNGKE